MLYYFQDKHKLLKGNPQFKEYNYMFNSYEMELYSVASAGYRGLGVHDTPDSQLTHS
jgi:hypothetical protein